MELLLGDQEFDMATLFPQGTNSCCPHTVNLQDNRSIQPAGLNVQGHMINNANIVPSSFVDLGPLFSTGQLDSHIALLNKFADRGLMEQSPDFSSTEPRANKMELFGHITAILKAYTCAAYDPDQITPLQLLRQSTYSLLSHYDPDGRMSHPGESMDNAENFQKPGGSPDDIRSSISGPRNRGREFRSTNGQLRSRSFRFRLIDIKGRVPACCADQTGSRLIQQAIDQGATKQEINMVYDEIMPHAFGLSTDLFANHAIQKLLEYGPPFYRRKLISNLLGRVMEISMHVYGCRVIQKAFEVCDLDQKVVMAAEITPKVLVCSRDQNSNHVVQKCMECVPPQRIQNMFRAFVGKAKSLSMHACACRVVQKVLSHCENPEIFHAMVSEIMEFVHKLSSDPYGNYVVQHVVEQGGPYLRSVMVQKFQGRVVRMSYHKYASNVIEKCQSLGSYQDQQFITTEILDAGGGNRYDHLVDMMTDPCANYVVQKMMGSAEEWQLQLITDIAVDNLPRLLAYSHGRHVVAALEGILTRRAGRMVLLSNTQLPNRRPRTKAGR
ncbi:hypothetical protein ACP4OV_002149 [Aristida adscensionis]